MALIVEFDFFTNTFYITKINLCKLCLLGTVVVSVTLFVLARLSPYEWDNPYPCIEDPDEIENVFSLANSFWFTCATLAQQGADVAPASSSGRLFYLITYNYHILNDFIYYIDIL